MQGCNIIVLVRLIMIVNYKTFPGYVVSHTVWKQALFLSIS